MKLTKVTKERANQIEEESQGLVEFKWVDNTFKGVAINLGGGPLVIELGEYNTLIATEESKTEKYLLEWQAKVATEVVLMEKLFDTEDARKGYVIEHLPTMADDELTLSTVTVNDNCGCVETEEYIPF
jgi:hypothetical protein